jgi:hypothetical protein
MAGHLVQDGRSDAATLDISAGCDLFVLSILRWGHQCGCRCCTTSFSAFGPKGYSPMYRPFSAASLRMNLKQQPAE